MKSLFKKIVVVILTLEARIALFLWKPKIIAVTGSVGKTSTKDAIYTVFSKLATARKSEKSFNSELGVPLTILNLPNAWNNPFLWLKNIFVGFFRALFATCYMLHTSYFPKWLILEVGADHPGDIKKIARWLKPNIVVINMIGNLPVHLEFFKSPREVAKEKSFLAKALKKDGVLLAFADDAVVNEIAESQNKGSVLAFGFSPKAKVMASNYQITYKKDISGETDMPSGISFKINYDGKILPVIVKGALGKQHVFPVLAAFSATITSRLNAVEAINALREYETPQGRMRLVEGVKNSLIIDDTYNSSPVALKEALATLGEIKSVPSAKKIAVLGDMLELGKYSDEAHRKAGREAAAIADILCVVGLRARWIADGALDAKMAEDKIFVYENSALAGKEIQNFIQKNDIVLIKGSQGIRMEKIVKEIMAEPERAGELLVRQEKEWEKR